MNVWSKLFKPKGTKKAGASKPKSHDIEAPGKPYGGASKWHGDNKRYQPDDNDKKRAEFQSKFRKGFTGR